MGAVGQFLVGAGVSTANIAIHAMVMTLVVKTTRALATRDRSSQALFLTWMMIGTVSVLMAAHAFEVLVWALVYSILGVTAEGTSTIYFAFVNYTTLGYGDVIPNENWQLLGPITAMNGVLMFGWSTAVIFEVLRRSIEIDAVGLPRRDRG